MMKTTVSILMLLMIAAAPAASAGSIELRETAYVSGRVITLGDVAELNGSYAQGLEDWKVGMIPAGSESMRLTRQEIRSKLTEQNVHWGFVALRGGSEVQIVLGPEPTAMRANAAVSVAKEPAVAPKAGPAKATTETVASGRVTPGSVRQRLVQWIQQRTGASLDDLRIDYGSDRDAAVLDQLIGADQVFLDADSINPVGRVPVTISRFRNGQRVEQVSVPLMVSVRMPVVVAMKSMQRGDLITPADVQSQTRWIDNLSRHPVADPSQIVGKRLESGVKVGSILLEGVAEAPVLIKRGDTVRVEVVSGGVKVVTEARALEDGQNGQMIRLRKGVRGEEFVAFVSGRGQVSLASVPKTSENNLAVREVPR